MILAGNPLFLFYLSNPDFTLRRSNKSLKTLSTFFTNHQSTNQRSYPNQTIKLLTTSVVKFLASLNLPSPKPPLRPTISFSKAARAKRNRYLIKLPHIQTIPTIPDSRNKFGYLYINKYFALAEKTEEQVNL